MYKIFSTLTFLFCSVVLLGESEIKGEKLTGCKLPNGIGTISEQGSPDALKAGGYILQIPDGKLLLSFWDKAGVKPKSNRDYITKIRSSKKGDISYSSINGGTFLSISGKIRDLGKHYFYEFKDKHINRPEEVWGEEEKDSSGKGMSGAMENIKEGHCYLIETLKGKFALIRVLIKKERGVVIQWVYQPNGKCEFQVPLSVLLPVKKPNTKSNIDVNNEVAHKNRKIPMVYNFGLDGRDKSLDIHLVNRRKIIKVLINEIKENKLSTIQKSQVIKFLGEIRAAEAAPVLVSIIGFFDSSVPNNSLNPKVNLPSVTALVKIGKPGVTACLKSLSGKVTENKLSLIIMVLIKVEGVDFAELILNKKLSTAKTITEKKNYRAALEMLRLEKQKM